MPNEFPSTASVALGILYLIFKIRRKNQTAARSGGRGLEVTYKARRQAGVVRLAQFSSKGQSELGKVRLMLSGLTAFMLPDRAISRLTCPERGF